MTAHRVLLAALFLTLGIGGGYFFLSRAGGFASPGPQAATVLPAPRPLPQFTLVDVHGNSFANASLGGRWTLMFFGFTHCPDICPLTLQQLAAVRQRLSSNSADSVPDILFVSVDPERDTPELLGSYLAHFGAGVRGVTGSTDALRALTDSLGIHFSKSATNADDYSVNHSAAILAIDPRVRLAAVFSGPHDVDAIVHDVTLLQGSGL